MLKIVVSAQVISNIIKNYKDYLTGYNIASIRDFVVLNRKENRGIKECVLGYRFTSILDVLGISNDDELSIFVTVGHEISNQLDITPIVMRNCLLKLSRIGKIILPSQLKISLQQQRQKKSLKMNYTE